MTSSLAHQFFGSDDRITQSLWDVRCQNILYKAVFEHFIELPRIAALLLASKSFQNSSFGANFIVNFIIDEDSISLFESVLTPSSCFSLQFVPSLCIKQSPSAHENKNRGIANFVDKLITAKYFQPSLRSLSLESVTNSVLSTFFGFFSHSWPQLHDLRLERCSLNNTVLEIISNNALQLRTVNLSGSSGISDDGMQHLSKLFGITFLDLSCCHKITDAGLVHVSSLSGITSFKLVNCNSIRDEGCEHISKLSRITVLDLSWCNMITDAGVDRIISSLSGITSLNFSYCHLISDDGIQHISKLPGITLLDLASCGVITDAGLIHVSKLSGITSLNLQRCGEITDAGLEHLSQLSCITFLSLQGCNEITDAGIELVSKLSSITSLDLTECEGITREARDNFKVSCPNCVVYK